MFPQANDEIQRLWIEHEDQIRGEKEKQLTKFENENKNRTCWNAGRFCSGIVADRDRPRGNPYDHTTGKS